MCGMYVCKQIYIIILDDSFYAKFLNIILKYLWIIQPTAYSHI